MKTKNNPDIQNEGLAKAPLSKKIGFFSAMMIVVSSSIGAGIFFKAGEVLNNSHGSVIFAIFCWLLAAFAIICMALAIVEISSGTHDSLSMIGWCKKFNSRFIYKSCKNFMLYIYLPFTFFVMPYYVIMTFQDAIISVGGSGSFGLGHQDWIVVMLIALVITIYFMFISGLFTKVGNINSWIIVSVKFIPLVLAAIIGFVVVGKSGFQGAGNGIDFVPQVKPIKSMTQVTPFFGLFIAIGAIFFAYDGFYVCSGLQTEMKQPKKTPIAILMGLILVTVIYLIIGISMSIGSKNGAVTGFQEWLAKYTSINGVNWLYAVIQVLIGVGILGIINGFAMWNPRFTEDLIKEREVPFADKFIHKLNKDKPMVGVVYSLCITVPIVVIFTIIGALGFQSNDYSYPSQGLNNLYSFVDLMSTWTAVIIFSYIVFAIYGGLRNRKTKKVEVQRTKYFVPTAICAIIFVSIPLFFVFVQPIVDLCLLTNFKFTHEDLVTRIMTLVVLIIIILISTVTVWIENAVEFYKEKKYISDAKSLELEIQTLFNDYKNNNDHSILNIIEKKQNQLDRCLNAWKKQIDKHKLN